MEKDTILTYSTIYLPRGNYSKYLKVYQFYGNFSDEKEINFYIKEDDAYIFITSINNHIIEFDVKSRDARWDTDNRYIYEDLSVNKHDFSRFMNNEYKKILRKHKVNKLKNGN